MLQKNNIKHTCAWFWWWGGDVVLPHIPCCWDYFADSRYTHFTSWNISWEIDCKCLFWAAAVQVLHPERFTTLVWAMDKYYGSGLTTSMNQSHMNQRSNIIEAIAKPWEDPLLWFATWLVVACHWALLWFCDLTCCGLQLGWKMKHFGLRRFSMHPMILREYVFVWVYLSLSCLALQKVRRIRHTVALTSHVLCCLGN